VPELAQGLGLNLPDALATYPDVLVHIETLRRFGLTELLPSRFKGLMAHEVRSEDVPLQPASR
jgi:hypothetical protein